MSRLNLVASAACLITVLVIVHISIGEPINNQALRSHIEILASDSLEGRRVGEAGEEKAAAYISAVFSSLDLKPRGDSGSYLQKFEFTKEIKFGAGNRLIVNGHSLKLRDEFQPMLQSVSAAFEFDSVISVGYGITVPHSSYDDYFGKNVQGKAVLIKRYSPGDENPGTVPEEYAEIEWSKYSPITDKILNAVEHGASGIFFVTPDYQDDTLFRRSATRVKAKKIPVVLLRRASFDKISLDLDNPSAFSANGEIELVRVRDTGYNVLAYLPSHNDTTVVIGAHYDHLGWGAPGSLYRGSEPMIHYGADDNGSGTAGLLELAREYSTEHPDRRYSILFAAFSGEEAGLLGSNFFTKNMTIDSNKVRMMINMDMVGRLSEQDNGLAIFGTGTCQAFKEYFDSLEYDEINLTIKESGTGPSDHTSFYNSDIPVLFFFTGSHEDYHKPGDIAEKIDYDGLASVVKLISQIIDHFDSYDGELLFQRTKDDDSGKRRTSFSVTLGIMPDYISEVAGLKIDGITADQAAERAGIKKGDVIIKMGRYTVDDIYAYMNALGKFRKGDTTTVMVDRNGDTLVIAVNFN